ncbi:MAG: CPBP family intramembrane metalloprotease [Deltaproteobacteria bacterium]|nr:CPBP family intramembrane metalloprotease [Deltaproteobacteria bacterium]
MNSGKTTIYLVTIVVEGGLALAAYTYAHFRGLTWQWAITWQNLLLAIALTLPLVALNMILLWKKLNEFYFYQHTHEFIKTIVKPFCDALSYKDVVFVSICAGIGEELLFRGVLLPEVGIFFSSFLFSFGHFGSKAFYYKFMAILYFFIGLYFAWIYQKTESMFLIISIHSMYDFIAIAYLKKYRTGS